MGLASWLMCFVSFRIRLGCSWGRAGSEDSWEKKSEGRESESASAGRESSASKISSSNAVNFSKGTGKEGVYAQ